MSAIENAPKNRTDKVKSRKLSTRIDMTPMVDLAFLLLTFFILTSELQKKFVMQIMMPDKPTNEDVISASKVLTIILDRNNSVYWYNGPEPVIQKTNFDASGIRGVIRQKKESIPGLLIAIKATDEAKYKNLIDILDEVVGQKVERYAIVDVEESDLEMMRDIREP